MLQKPQEENLQCRKTHHRYMVIIKAEPGAGIPTQVRAVTSLCPPSLPTVGAITTKAKLNQKEKGKKYPH